MGFKMSMILGGSQPEDNPEFKKSPYQRDQEARAAAAQAAKNKEQPKSGYKKIWDMLGGKVD
jgi:hypothetical protein